MAFALVIALAAVFAVASPLDIAVAQNSDNASDGEDKYQNGEHTGKSCPNKERKSQEQSS
jgi:hypothetical protein